MPTEIERKFLVADDGWRRDASVPRELRQGYLALTKRAVIRVRLVDGKRAWVGIKEHRIGRSHGEYEYEIPVGEAWELLGLCTGAVIEKRRYLVPVGQHYWEVDEFLGENAGLIMAEIELRAEDEVFREPDWLGREVTDERRFYNAALSERPWALWSEADRR